MKALDDMSQITDYCPQGVAVAHDEFRGMGLSGVTGFLGAGGVVVGVRGVFDAGEVKKQRLHYETL